MKMLLPALAIGLLVVGPMPDANASCIAVDVRREGNVCRAYVTNHCGRPLQCFVLIIGYTSGGRSYRESGTVHLGPGRRGSYGIGGVIACGNANAQCQNAR